MRTSEAARTAGPVSRVLRAADALLPSVQFFRHVRGALDLVFDTARGRVHFEVIGPIEHIELIAEGRGVRIKRFLRSRYGGRRWRKLKGHAVVRLDDGRIRRAEIHWYEAHGIGRKGFKISRLFPDG